MPNRVLIILNPSAGQGDPGSLRDLLHASLKEMPDWIGEIRETAGAGDASRWAGAAESEGYDRVVAVGGDGTVTEAAEGLLRAESDRPLGIIPGGTANVLAEVLEVPADPSAALAVALSGQTRRFDVGYLPEQDRFFLIGLGVGIPGQTVENAGRDAKHRFGFVAYLGAFLEGLIENRSAVLDIELDGKSVVTQGQSAVIANPGEMEILGVALAHGVSPHDGTLHLFVIDHTEPGAVLKGLRQLLGGERKQEIPGFLHRQGRSIRISTSPALSVQIDGEWIGRTPIEVTLAPRRVRLVVGKDYPEGEDDVLQASSASPREDPSRTARRA